MHPCAAGSGKGSDTPHHSTKSEYRSTGGHDAFTARFIDDSTRQSGIRQELEEASPSQREAPEECAYRSEKVLWVGNGRRKPTGDLTPCCRGTVPGVRGIKDPAAVVKRRPGPASRGTRSVTCSVLSPVRGGTMGATHLGKCQGSRRTVNSPAEISKVVAYALHPALSKVPYEYGIILEKEETLVETAKPKNSLGARRPIGNHQTMGKACPVMGSLQVDPAGHHTTPGTILRNHDPVGGSLQKSGYGSAGDSGLSMRCKARFEPAPHLGGGRGWSPHHLPGEWISGSSLKN